MRRKVIKQGHNTLTITLPSKWAIENNISAGDELSIEESHRSLKISTDNDLKRDHIEIDVSGLDVATIRQKLRSVYKLGYEEIRIIFQNNLVKELRTENDRPIMELINHEVSNLIGCEVIKQTDKSCVIKDYAVDSELEFKNTLRRVFLLLQDYGGSLIDQIKANDRSSLQGMRDRHFNIAKFIFYCQRLINKEGVVDRNKMTFLYYVVSELDEILDIMKYAAHDYITFPQKKVHKETILLLEKIIDHNTMYMEFFYKPTPQSMLRMADERWIIRKHISKLIGKIPANELALLKDISFILELYYHMVEPRLSIGENGLHP